MRALLTTHRRQIAPVCALLLFAFALSAACSGGAADDSPPPTPIRPVAGALTVRSFEWGFDPAAILLQQGEPLELTFTNEGEGVLHNFKLDDLEAGDVVSESTGALSADEGELFVGAKPGDQGTLSFVPQETGVFTYYCTIRGHRSLGMEGTLIVE